MHFTEANNAFLERGEVNYAFFNIIIIIIMLSYRNLRAQ